MPAAQTAKCNVRCEICKCAMCNVQCAMCNVQCSMQCQLCSAQLLLSVTKSLVSIKELAAPLLYPLRPFYLGRIQKKQTNLGFSPKEPAEKKLKGGDPHYIIS